MVKEKKSNFELLRIIAILMIIMHHYFAHGLTQVDNGITFNLILSKILNFGKLSNHIFILLTGYFMIKSKINYKKIIALVLEMSFYSITISCIFYGFHIVEFNAKLFIESFFPIIWGNWFVVYYIILYLLIPYINLFIEKIDKNQLKKLIIILILLYCIIPTFTNNAWGLTAHNFFVLDYLIGAYFRLYPINRLNDNKFNIKMLLIVSILSILSIFSLMFIGKLFNISKIIKHSNYFLANNYSIVGLSIAIFIFSIFKNININSKTINYISSSVLGIYLIHDNKLIRPWLWRIIWPNMDYINSNLFILHVFAKVLFVFLVCLIIDKIRRLLLNRVEDKLSDKIFNLLLKVKNIFNMWKNKTKKNQYEYNK